MYRHAPPATEVLVVDDGSPGAAASAAAAEYGAAVVRLEERRGFCAAANAGAAAAAAPVVELLNDDAEATEGWAAAALWHFDDPRVAAVAPLVLCWPGGDRIDSAGDRYFVGGVAAKRGRGERVGPEYLTSRRVFGASASSAFYRRDALARVGAFPESFGAYFDDVDLAFRLNRAGYRAVYEPGARVLHRVSASHGRPRGRLLEQQSRNEELVFWRNLPAGVLALALPLHLAVLAGKAWRRWREGELLSFARGRLRALGEAPALLRHRRALRQLGPASAFRDWGVESLWPGTAPEKKALLP